MPTASKFFGAFGFALVAFFAANTALAYLPDGKDPGWLVPICVVIGAASGWRLVVPNSERSYRLAMGNGLKAAMVMFFYCLLYFSLEDMVQKSLSGQYNGSPLTAITDALSMIGTKAWDLLVVGAGETAQFRPEFAIVLVGGGLLAGAMVQWASHRWR